MNELQFEWDKRKEKTNIKKHGSPYQSLINLYLRDCASNGRKLHMKWQSENAEQ
jgi:uncharacterized DUF497 family protein